jgi:hypothetical protein
MVVDVDFNLESQNPKSIQNFEIIPYNFNQIVNKISAKIVLKINHFKIQRFVFFVESNFTDCK